MTQDLFSKAAQEDFSLTPLSDRMRPTSLSEFKGQHHILGKHRFLTKAIDSNRVPSLILWGPPGTGKTTLARILAHQTSCNFVSYSAVGGSVKEVREIIKSAAEKRNIYRKKTIFFVDEIHRFNKAQQDVLLPSVEKGIVTLIGATTENPSFSVIPALLSRCKVLGLESLDLLSIKKILQRALADKKRGLGNLTDIEVQDDVLIFLADRSRGDARYALNALELSVAHALESDNPNIVDIKTAEEATSAKALLYDKTGEEHYNVVSAFIKSLRGSDPDGALYWMFRMIEAGEDPLFILRRMIVFASEDIGNADPHALQVVMSADAAFLRLGMPEGAYPMAQICTYLACAPKSNAQVDAIADTKKAIKQFGSLPVPKKLRNASTKHMKEWGYGQGYRYPPQEGGFAKNETYLPKELVGQRYYQPRDSGIESKIKTRLKWLRGEED